MQESTQMLGNLRIMLRDVLLSRQAGATHQKLARAQGHIDGYMQCLLDHKLATQAQLLALCAAERAAVAGPATREVDALVGAA